MTLLAHVTDRGPYGDVTSGRTTIAAEHGFPQPTILEGACRARDFPLLGLQSAIIITEHPPKAGVIFGELVTHAWPVWRTSNWEPREAASTNFRNSDNSVIAPSWRWRISRHSFAMTLWS